MMASVVVHLAFGYLTTLTVDLAFLIESQTESELPERILGAVRFSEIIPASATPIKSSLSSENGPSDDLQSSLPTRWWKSLGQGLSRLIRHGSQEGSHSGQAHVDGGTDHEGTNEKTENCIFYM